MARAKSSLPVPDSPEISTVASHRANRGTYRYFFQKLGALADNLFEPDILLESFHQSASPRADSRLTLQTRQYFGSAQRRQQEIRRACLQQWKNIERIRVHRRDQQWAIRKGPLKRRKQRLNFCWLKRIERGDDYVRVRNAGRSRLQV